MSFLANCANYTVLRCNFFAFLFEILRTGDTLGKPYGLSYKRASNLLLQCRFRCLKYRGKHAHENGPCRCALRSRLRKDGAWEVSFTGMHNHDISPVPCATVISGLMELYISLQRFHGSIKSQFNEWYRDLSNEEKAMVPTVDVQRPVGFDLEYASGGDDMEVSPQRIEAPPVYPLDEDTGTKVLNNIRDLTGAYLASCAPQNDGKEIVQDLKHIMESFGYPVRVRNSKYKENPDPSMKHQVLLRVYFQCNKGDSCPFRLTVRRNLNWVSNDVVEEANYKEDIERLNRQKSFIMEYKNWHNHSTEYWQMQSTLPKYIWDEAMFMKKSSLIPTGLIVRYLEDRYGFLLKRDSFARKLRYQLRKKYPLDEDCRTLIGTLVNMQSKDPGMYVRVDIAGHTALNAVCWGEKQWLTDYLRFGVVPGVSLDSKAIANVYDIPFVSIGGRDNDGHLLIIFMEFRHK